MRRELLALGITASILLSLVAVSQPTGAVLTTVSGPDDVRKPDTVEFDTSVEIRQDERIPIRSFNLVIETDDAETVTVKFAPNGTILDVSPAGGVVGNGDIRVNLLRRTLEISPIESNADFGTGDLSGTDERTGEAHSFGYGDGFGYGDAQPTFGFRVEMDSKAFKHGEYTVWLSVNTDGEDRLFTSNEKHFEVLVPSGIQPGDRGGGQGSSAAGEGSTTSGEVAAGAGGDGGDDDADEGEHDEVEDGDEDDGEADEDGGDDGSASSRESSDGSGPPDHARNEGNNRRHGNQGSLAPGPPGLR